MFRPDIKHDNNVADNK